MTCKASGAFRNFGQIQHGWDGFGISILHQQQQEAEEEIEGKQRLLDVDQKSWEFPSKSLRGDFPKSHTFLQDVKEGWKHLEHL